MISFGELPGLVIDRFGDIAAVQPNAAWVERLLPELTEALIRVTGGATVLKNAGGRRRGSVAGPRDDATGAVSSVGDTLGVVDFPTSAAELERFQDRLAAEDPVRFAAPSRELRVAAVFACFARGGSGRGEVGDIGWAIQQFAESQGCSVVREFVGHGVGFDFHEAPQVPHFGRKHTGVPLAPGMVFTVEPMINLGQHRLRILDDKWTAVTADGSLSAQFEQTVLVTEDGYDSLTPFDL